MMQAQASSCACKRGPDCDVQCVTSPTFTFITMETPERVRQFKSQKTLKSCNREQSILSLPEHLVVSCLARVPISSYRSMSQVCQAWRRILKQKQVWKARHDLNAAEAGELVFLRVLYILRFRDLGSKSRKCKEVAGWRAFHPLSNTWFRVPAMPEDGRVLGGLAYATLDGKLYVIGGDLKGSGLSCRTVSYSDVSQYCWRLGPPLNEPRSSCTVGVIWSKLYAFGGFSINSPAAANKDQDVRVVLQTAEVYDPLVGSWRLISNKIPIQLDYSIAMDGNFFAIGTSGEDIRHVRNSGPFQDWTKLAGVVGTVYNPQSNKWTQMAHGLMHGWKLKCVDLNGRLYTANSCHGLSFYDSSKGSWQSVQLSWERIQTGNLSSDGSALRFLLYPSAWYFELRNLKGMLCMIGLRPLPQRAFVAVLDMEEHLSEEGGIRIRANVVMLEKITNRMRGRGSTSGVPLRLKRILSCEMIDA